MNLPNPALYEINTRVFLRQFSTPGNPARLTSVPLRFWQSLAGMGFTHVWLMGIWKTSPSLVDACCFQEGLVRAYDKALKDWMPADVIGSPYAITEYSPDPSIASIEELALCRNAIAGCGLGLILDFIPNHFSAASPLLASHPYLFLHVDEENYRKDTHTFFPVPGAPGSYAAHGRDPFFPAWTDTAQVDYCSPEARSFMAAQLLSVASLCDGVRCDMAMLVLSNVFRNTWGGVLNASVPPPAVEFWYDAITTVKGLHPGFMFIAEAYWNLEWDLQQLGFDFTYDKKLYDRLKEGNPESIHGHLRADADYSKRMVRFIENHDEERAVIAFGREKSLAAAVITATIPGMNLIHDGQLAGKKIKLPVQLGREPLEATNHAVEGFYTRLLAAVNSNTLRNGTWELLSIRQSWDSNDSYRNLLAWLWSHGQSRCLVVVNFSSRVSQCRIPLNLPGYGEQVEFYDVLHGNNYFRSAEEVQHEGLYIELAPWHAHIFNY